jgi:hypothetical protein
MPSLGMPIRLNEQDMGPFRIDLVLGVWVRIGRAIDAMRALGFSAATADEMHAVLVKLAADGRTETSDDRIVKALRFLALQDGMHANDWLRMRFADEQAPRRKPPASVDLQIRLRNVQCNFLVARICRGKPDSSRCDGERLPDTFRVTIRTMRGDVASCESEHFAHALDGAVAMAGVNASESP